MKYYKRQWLNHNSGRAYVIADIYTLHQYVTALVEIGDCRHSVTLEFDFETTNKQKKKQRIQKLDRLIETLQNVRNKINEL